MSSSEAIARLQAVMANISERGSSNNATNVPAFSSSTTPSKPAAPTSNDNKQVAAVAEDAVQDGGNAIDTFSSYIPSALPRCVLKALFEANQKLGDTTDVSKQSAQKQNDVIELLDSDSDDECETNDTKPAPPAKSLSNSEYSSQLFNGNNALIESHTSTAVESALLSSVSACNFSSDGSYGALQDEAASTILPLVIEGKLSPLQAEAVALATTRFNRVFTSDKAGSSQQSGSAHRAGFFLGDGAGIGKGRQIAALIRDAFCRNHGYGRQLWVSTSRELVEDAKRDLRDIGCHVDVHDGVDLFGKTGANAKGLGVGGSLGKGVLFITYSLLVSGKRLDDILQWLTGGNSNNSEQSYDGMIVFDEAHKAKNLEADTRTAKLVIALQERLPNARVLYCSATGVSEIAHMAYAVRLGLWGSANPLYPTFDSFQDALKRRGVGAMEMLALEMKRKGLFLARTLSWEGADFHTVEVRLGPKQIASYDGAVQWWFKVKREISNVLSMLNMPPKTLWRLFYAAQQRFYKEMCICAKVDEVVAQAKKYLESDHSIVIGLQSTGEAGMDVSLNELAESLAENGTIIKDQKGKVDFENVDLCNLLSTCGSIMGNFLRNHFPVAPPPQEPPKIPPVPPNGFASEFERLEHARLVDFADRIRNMPPPQPVDELVRRRGELLRSIRDLDLPPNPLDDIIDRFGVENVAEMTGRSGRILRKSGSKFRYTKRFGQSSKASYGLSMPTNSEDESDSLNIKERKMFMDGKKCVAIISDAASTGVSLHSDRRCKSNHKRRVHFTIELPWAADKAIQQLGRSHRSGQVSAPIYKMIVTDLGGERRFASAVSKRMAQLGALTKGDRRAATGTDLSEFDVDSVFGRRALVKYYAALSVGSNEPTLPSRHSKDILDEFISNSMQEQSHCDAHKEALHAAASALDDVGLGGEPNVKKFLNRIAGLEVQRQRLVFSLFMSTLDDVIADAKATGEFEGSVEDIKATSITLKSEKHIATDASCGAKTELTRLVIDRGVSFNAVVETIVTDSDVTEEKETNRKHAKSGFYISKRKIAGRRLVMFAKQKVSGDSDGGFDDPLKLMVITRANTGRNPVEMPSKELHYKYDLLVSSDDIAHHLHSLKDKESDTDCEEQKSDGADTPVDATVIVRENWKHVAALWDEAYDKSNFMEHNDGLAPRISEIGLITGAVLHVLPALEKAVQVMSSVQRSLRVMRVETDSGRRIVGIKFPVTHDSIERLMVNMTGVSNARQGLISSFVDEPFRPISEKAMKWATTERKTMKSFFGVASSRPSSVAPLKPANNKRKQESTKTQAKKTKTSNISSFFGTKKDY